MTGWTIRQRVLFSFAVVLALMAVMAGVALERLARIEKEVTGLQTDSLPGLHISSRLMAACLEDFSDVQSHVISDDIATMKSMDATIHTGWETLSQIERRYEGTVWRAEDRTLLDAYKAAYAPYRTIEERVLALSTARKTEEAHRVVEGELRPAFLKVRQAIEGLVNGNWKQAESSSQHIVGSVSAADWGVVFSGGAALLLALGCGYLLLQAITRPLARLVDAVDVMRTGDFSRRLQLARSDEFSALSEGFNRMCDELTDLVAQVQRSGVQVNTSVTEIAATSKQQQATATEVAATTTEIGATSREIAATSKELVRTMTEVASVAEHSASLAANGQAGLTQMGETMRRVMDATGSINAKLAVLNEKAGNIGRVVTTITRVADQTNLLSLNASIEAEKAGQYGRGFSVVATEIRRLADQTAVATSDIEKMVKDIQSAVSAGVMGMDRFSEEVRTGMLEVQHVGAQLSEIILQVQAMAPRCEAVNEGMQAQAKAAEQITQSLTQLSEAAQQTVESLRQSSQAMLELNQVTTGLRAGISRFKLVSGEAAHPH